MNWMPWSTGEHPIHWRLQHSDGIVKGLHRLQFCERTFNDGTSALNSRFLTVVKFQLTNDVLFVVQLS